MKFLFTYRIGRNPLCQCCVLSTAHLTFLKQGWKKKDTLWRESPYNTKKKITLVMNKQWWNVYFFGVFRPRLGVPWENRGRRATPNSIVSLWTVSRKCCMERCAVYSRGVGLLRDHFHSLRLLKIPGSWRCSEGGLHPRASERGVRSSRVMGLTSRPPDKIPNYCGEMSECLPWLFVWKSFAFDWMFLLEALGPGRQPPRIRLEGSHPFGLPTLVESVRSLDLSLPSPL